MWLTEIRWCGCVCKCEISLAATGEGEIDRVPPLAMKWRVQFIDPLPPLANRWLSVTATRSRERGVRMETYAMCTKTVLSVSDTDQWSHILFVAVDPFPWFIHHLFCLLFSLAFWRILLLIYESVCGTVSVERLALSSAVPRMAVTAIAILNLLLFCKLVVAQYLHTFFFLHLLLFQIALAILNLMMRLSAMTVLHCCCIVPCCSFHFFLLLFIAQSE